MATHRQLTQDEGRELYNRRNAEYKLPFPLLEPETLLDDEEEELQRSYKANKRPRSQLKDYLQASRKRKAPYRDVLPCYSSGYNTYNPFATLSGFGTGFGPMSTSINDLSYSYQSIPAFSGLEIDLCKNYRNQYLASSFDNYISPTNSTAAAAYYYGYENYPTMHGYSSSVNSDRDSSGNSIIDMEVIRSQMSAYGTLSDLDQSLALGANVPKLLTPYIGQVKGTSYSKYSNSDEQYSHDTKPALLSNQICQPSSLYLYDQPLLNFPGKDFNKKSEK